MRPSLSGRRYSAFETADLDSPGASLLTSYFEAASISELPSLAAHGERAVRAVVRTDCAQSLSTLP